MNIKTKIAHFSSPLYLESGRILEPYEIAYETYGELNEEKSNVILVCHALSGSHHAAGFYDGDRKPGWWDGLIGEKRAIDTTKYFVICTNVIGSCFGSTGPMSESYPSLEPYRLKFPVVTIKDMICAQMHLLSQLGIYHVRAIIGGSMGGMQALQFAVDYPNFADEIISLAATYATRPWTIAFNKVTIEAIRRDPRFKHGNYGTNDFKEEGLDGLAIGRIAGHISYLSPDSMDEKFGRNYVSNDGLFELFGRYEVERYMEYNTNNFARIFDPLSYLYIVKAINTFNLSRGYDSLHDAISRIKARVHLISFSSDYLFFPSEMEHIAHMMARNRQPHTYVKVESNYGHDAFLVEIEKFDQHIRNILCIKKGRHNEN
ncbi:MAG: homoserine O-acetyltransferase [Sulfurovum sp.]|nr:homoserine O-acetyltransferase [Sulfurovum sp.]MCB4744374.1 homoserine O-acetyltransferase [Sulfurovum sp.]MCB4746486.1 homoserine O-acetyltransferase [Sulfurovum sp.]MCB4749423.1 homoserine O-acetyltransferase [Sulfurovum sp.]MCB4750496.1 homoserine O-acetyltransferase [Sulfurovum sp.]